MLAVCSLILVAWPLELNPLKTRRRLLYVKTQFVLRSKHILSLFLTFCWPCISVYLSQLLTNLMHNIFVLQWVYFMPLHVSSTSAHHQEVKIALHSLWYHHTYRCDDDTRSCVKQFWPPDDEHMCSKHVEAWNKLIVKQKYCASSWLITELKILFILFIKTDQFISYGAEVAVCSEINIKRINTVWAECKILEC